MKKETGFTLVELMVTLAVAAVLFTVGVPNIIEAVRSNRMIAQSNRLVMTLNVARSEAVKRGVQVTVRQAGAEWEGGWRVFSDQDGDGTLDPADGDTEIRVEEALPEGYTLRTGANYTDWVAFLPTGESRGSGPFPNDTFRLCADDQDNERGQSVAINTVGRLHQEKGTTACP